MQDYKFFQFIGQVAAPLRFTAAEGLFLTIVSVGQVVNAAQSVAEEFAVGHHAAHGNTSEIDAVIAAFTTNQPRARALAFRAVIGDGDFEGGVSGFRTGVAEEGVIQITGRHG